MIIFPYSSLQKFNQVIHENIVPVSRYMMRRINLAMDTNEDTIHLFKFDNTEVYAKVESTEFMKMLTDLLNTFIQYDEFEYAAECKKIMNKWRGVQLQRALKHQNINITFSDVEDN